MLRLILISLIVLAHNRVEGYSFGSSISVFSGRTLVSGATNTATMEMKKGKANVPPSMRAQYKRQQEMQEQKDAMIAASKPGEDGLPIFNLFVRTPRNNMWYPCGSFKGDDRSQALCKSYVDGGFMAGMAKKQLDTGLSGSLFQDLDRLKGTIIRAYPQLKKNQRDLEFGYKIGFEGMEDQEMSVVVPKEQKGLFDNVKAMFS